MRAVSLRRLTQRLGRRSLQQSSRFEDTSVAAVNAWLAEPPSKPTWTIAGACAAHDVFDLNADVVVADIAHRSYGPYKLAMVRLETIYF